MSSVLDSDIGSIGPILRILRTTIGGSPLSANGTGADGSQQFSMGPNVINEDWQIQYHCPGLTSCTLVAANKSNKIHNVIKKKRLDSKLKQVYPLFRPRNSILLQCRLR